MGSSEKGPKDDSATLSNATTLKIDSDSETETVDEAPRSPGPAPFEEGEKVLAFHREQIYPAKVMKLEREANEWQFLLHYPGWNKQLGDFLLDSYWGKLYCNSWDEWVGVDRLMKYNEENVRLQKMQNEMQKQKDSKPAKRHLHGKQKGSRRRKPKSDLLDKEKGTASLDKFVSLQIPTKLKKQLVDDCEFITNLGKLVKLPRTPNVDDILSKYRAYRLKKDGIITESVEDILRGLRCYFDKALPVMLLYKSERQQYDGAIKEGISPCTVYGAEHLLRLFVKLPELLAFANIDEETHMELQTRLMHFLKFLQKNQSVFFLSTNHAMEGAEANTNKQETS